MGVTIYKKVTAILGICLVVLTISGCDKAISVGFSDNQVCRVGSQYVTKEQTAVLLTGMQRQYEKTFGSDNLEKTFGDGTLEDYIKEQVKTQLVQLASLNEMAQEKGITLNKTEKKVVSDATESYMSAFTEKQIKAAGFAKEDVEELYTQYALAQKMYESLTESVDKEISDDAARIIDVQVIFFSNETTDANGKKSKLEGDALNEWKNNAYQVWERAAAGENFESLASQYNQAEQTEYHIGRGEMKCDAFDDAAFQLKNDEISGLVETDNGIYIIRCMSNYDQAQTDANKEKMYEQQCSDAFNKAYDSFMEDVKVKLNDDCWNKVQLLKDTELPDVDFVQIYNSVSQNH